MKNEWIENFCYELSIFFGQNISTATAGNQKIFPILKQIIEKQVNWKFDSAISAKTFQMETNFLRTDFLRTDFLRTDF